MSQPTEEKTATASETKRNVLRHWPKDVSSPVIPARFERATRSLEGCCSIQLSYGTIGKYAAQRTICAAKIGKVFHNSPRQSKKSHIRHSGNMPSMRKRRIDRTSGNTPQKPRFPVPERHPRHNRHNRHPL